jgi:hypothetical protein
MRREFIENIEEVERDPQKEVTPKIDIRRDQKAICLNPKFRKLRKLRNQPARN